MEAFAEALTPVLVIGILVLAYVWRSNHKDRNRQETLKMLIDNGHNLDDTRIQKLLNPQPESAETPTPVEGYRVLQILGVMTIFVSIGVTILLNILGSAVADPEVQAAGFGIGALLLLIGVGLLFCTRFVPKPRDDNQD